MGTSRYATSRQKACHFCSLAKAKCDRKPTGCSRCSRKGLHCQYLRHLQPSDRELEAVADVDDEANADSISFDFSSSSIGLSPGLNQELGSSVQTYTPIPLRTSALPTNSCSSTAALPPSAGHNLRSASSNLGITSGQYPDFEKLYCSNTGLCCTINADDIRNRWLNSYLPVPGQQTKNYPAHVTAFIHRMLKSYVAMAVRSSGAPPFVHASQISPESSSPPLSTCLTLIRICEQPLKGSEKVVANVLNREMDKLYDEHQAYDVYTLLSAYQAYLIYSMILFFRLGPSGDLSLRQAMMNLQDLASATVRQGIMCRSEQQRTRPAWETWIVAESKRRTVFTMYLFDSLLSAQDGLPTFLGIELQGLPASSTQSLWKARMRREWDNEYNMHLTRWVDGDFCINELWPVSEDSTEHDISNRHRRIDLWLETVDEFGTMLYAVTSYTHGD